VVGVGSQKCYERIIVRTVQNNGCGAEYNPMTITGEEYETMMIDMEAYVTIDAIECIVDATTTMELLQQNPRQEERVTYIYKRETHSFSLSYGFES
jgi:hypothetical protein